MAHNVAQNREAGRPVAPGVTVKEPIDLERYLPYRMDQLTHLIASPARTQVAAAAGVTTREWRVMMVLASSGPQAVGEIAAAICADLASTTRSIQTLTHRHLVQRRTPSSDRRRQIIALSVEGAALHDRIAAVRLEDEHRLTAVLTADERDMLFDFLDRLRARATELYAPKPDDPYGAASAP